MLFDFLVIKSDLRELSEGGRLEEARFLDWKGWKADLDSMLIYNYLILLLFYLFLFNAQKSEFGRETTTISNFNLIIS